MKNPTIEIILEYKRKVDNLRKYMDSRTYTAVKIIHSNTTIAILQSEYDRLEDIRSIILGEVIKCIVSDYDEATMRYKRAKTEREEGKRYAEADCISENSKQVALSRLEPKLSKVINQAIQDQQEYLLDTIKELNKENHD